MTDESVAISVVPLTNGIAFAKELFDKTVSGSSLTYSSNKRLDEAATALISNSRILCEVSSNASFTTGDSSVSRQGFVSHSAFMTSDPTEVPFNVSDHLKVPEGCVLLRVSDFVPWDNPDNLISQKVEEMFDMIVAVVFLNIFYLIRCVCVWVGVYVCVTVCVCVNICACLCMHVCVSVHACKHLYVD